MKATFVAAEDALGEALAKIAEGLADARRATHVREDDTVVSPYATWQEAYNDALLVTAKQSVEIASQRVEIDRLTHENDTLRRTHTSGEGPDEVTFDLKQTAVMLATYTAEIFPQVNEQGQIHFGRAMMEASAEAINKHLATRDVENAKLRAVLVRLSNEVIGSFGMAESALRQVLGNTNYNIISRLAEEARAAIKQAQEKTAQPGG